MRAAMAMAPRPLRPAALFSPTPEGAGVLVALPAASDLVVGVSMTGGTAVVLLSTTGGTVVVSTAVVSTAVVSTATALVVTTTLVEVSTLVVSALEDPSEPLPASGLSQSFSVAGRTSSEMGQYMSVLSGIGDLKLTDGNVGTTLGDHTRGSGASDIVEVLADAGEIGLVTLGLAGDGIVKARNSALGNVAEGLSRDGGGEGSNSERVLHFEGCSWLSLS